MCLSLPYPHAGSLPSSHSYTFNLPIVGVDAGTAPACLPSDTLVDTYVEDLTMSVGGMSQCSMQHASLLFSNRSALIFSLLYSPPGNCRMVRHSVCIYMHHCHSSHDESHCQRLSMTLDLGANPAQDVNLEHHAMPVPCDTEAGP